MLSHYTVSDIIVTVNPVVIECYIPADIITEMHARVASTRKPFYMTIMYDVFALIITAACLLVLIAVLDINDRAGNVYCPH